MSWNSAKVSAATGEETTEPSDERRRTRSSCHSIGTPSAVTCSSHGVSHGKLMEHLHARHDHPCGCIVHMRTESQVKFSFADGFLSDCQLSRPMNESSELTRAVPHDQDETEQPFFQNVVEQVEKLPIGFVSITIMRQLILASV